MKIFKYQIPVSDNFTLELPIGARILDVNLQYDKPFLWALIDENQKRIKMRQFAIFGTGQMIPPHIFPMVYIKTFQMHHGALIWHLFETTPMASSINYETPMFQGWKCLDILGD